MDVNRGDPVELALAADLQKAAISHVAGSSCNTYTGQCNLFVTWCDVLEASRVTLPASDATGALYLQSVVQPGEDLRAGEGRVRRDCILPEDKSLQPRANAVPGGLHCAECCDEVVWSLGGGGYVYT